MSLKASCIAYVSVHEYTVISLAICLCICDFFFLLDFVVFASLVISVLPEMTGSFIDAYRVAALLGRRLQPLPASSLDAPSPED